MPEAGGCESCERRFTVRGEKLQKALETRLRRIEGQVRGIQKMLESDAYCDDILNQITAIKAALDSSSLLILESHVRGCIAERIKDGDGAAVDELLSTIKKML